MTKEQLKTLKNDLKKVGYSVKIKHFSEFSKVYILDSQGKPINDGNVFSSEYLEKHKPAFDLIKQFKTMVLV